MTRPQSAAIVAREVPILFGAPMIRAILAGTKTQTRRVMKPQPHLIGDGNSDWIGLDGKCHRIRWRVGDRLWVRETWQTLQKWDSMRPRYLLDDVDKIRYEADAYKRNPLWAWGKLRPSIFMPRWASRITLEVTGIRVERLQAISEADALAEGIEGTEFWRDRHPPSICYSVLWNHINGPTSWDANPWVSVTEFQRVTP